tara:strand:+ start:89 stop:634 length:546 start_codon:yes stop_codon:yes gene_type:complete
MELIFTISIVVFIFWVIKRNKNIDKEFIKEEKKNNSQHEKETVQVKSDDFSTLHPYEIVGAFGDLMVKTSNESDTFFDVSVLPYPKKIIKEALFKAIKLSDDKDKTEQLKIGLLQLGQFQENIGSKPIKNPIRSVLQEIGEDIDEEIKKMAAVNEKDIEYHKSLQVIAEREYQFNKSLIDL